MGSGRGWFTGDWPSTGIVLNITAAAWTAGFLWWRSGNKKRMQNVSEYMLVMCGSMPGLWNINHSYGHWLPCIADTDIILLTLGFFFLSFYFSFFPRLISAVADWMSAILRHVVWP